jgi:hypothetical protein
VSNPLWDHPRKPMLIAKLDQDTEGIVGELLRRAAELDDLDEHEAAAAYCYDLVSDPAQTMVGLAAGVAMLAIRMHRGRMP